MFKQTLSSVCLVAVLIACVAAFDQRAHADDSQTTSTEPRPVSTDATSTSEQQASAAEGGSIAAPWPWLRKQTGEPPKQHPAAGRGVQAGRSAAEGRAGNTSSGLRPRSTFPRPGDPRGPSTASSGAAEPMRRPAATQRPGRAGRAGGSRAPVQTISDRGLDSVPQVEPQRNRGSLLRTFNANAEGWPGGGVSSASHLLNDPISGSLADDTQIDVYTFELTSAGSLFFDQLSTDNRLGINWQLEDPFGRILLEDVNSFDDAGPVFVAPGLFTVRVFAEAGQSGNYEFRLAAPTVDSSNVTTGIDLIGEIELPGAEDRYLLNVPAGTLLSIDAVTTNNVLGLNWRLKTPAGAVVASGGGSLSDISRIEAPGGDLELVVFGEGGGNGQTGTYTLHVYEVVDPVAQTITYGQTVDGSIDVPGKIERYSFNAAPGDTVVLDLLSATNTLGLNWELTDSLGRELLPQTSSLGDSTSLTLAGGSYSLTVLGELGGSHQLGDYSFRVINPVETTATIAIGDLAAGSIDPGDRAIYEFSGTPGQQVVIDLISSTNAFLLNWIIRDANGVVVLPTTGVIDDSLPVTLGSGTHRVEVFGESNSASGSYEFRLRDVVVTTTAVGALPYTAASGSIDHPGDIDRYTFNVPAGQLVTFDMVSSTNNNGMRWALYDAVDRAIFGPSLLSDVGPIALTGGDYALEFSANLGVPNEGGTYTFDLLDSGTAAPFTPGGSPISLGVQQDGAIAAAGSTDSYLLSLPVDTEIYLNIVTGASTLRYTLLDAVGQPVIGDTRFWLTPTDERGPFLLKAGDYELQIRETGTTTPVYSFIVWETDDRTETVTTDTVISRTISIPGSSERLEFSLAAPERVRLEITQSTGGVFWTLVDDRGNRLFNESNVTIDRGPFDLPAGNYAIEARIITTAPRTYGFRIDRAVDTATDIVLGQAVSGQIQSSSSKDVYRLDLTAQTDLYLDATSGQASVQWSLIDPIGQPVFTGLLAGSTYNVGPVPLPAGLYELHITSTNGATQAYGFTAYAANDRTFPAQAPTAVLAGTVAEGSTDRYELTIANDGDRVFFDNQIAVGGLRWRLLRQGGQSIYNFVIMNSTGTNQGPIELAADSYFLEVYSDSGASGTYQITAQLANPNEQPLIFDTPISDSVDAAGGQEVYTFTASDGQKLLFDTQAADNNTRWSLFGPGEVTTGPFNTAVLSNDVTNDVGPIQLQAGDYRLELFGTGDSTPSFTFQVLDLAHDLYPAAYGVSPPTLVDGQTGRQVTASWTVRNDGGTVTSGTWTDRLILSSDPILGNADDLILADEVVSEALANGETYSRARVLDLPDVLNLGDYRLYLMLDALGDLPELLGEDNNTTSRPLQVVVGDELEPAFQTVLTFGPVDVTAAVDSTGPTIVDLPLERAVDLTDVRFIGLDAVRFLRESGGSSGLEMILCDRDVEVVTIEGLGVSGGTASVGQVGRGSKQLDAADIPTLPSTSVDTLRLKFTSSSVGSASVSSTYADGKIRVHFATCEFEGCGPHRVVSYSDLPYISGSVVDWQEYSFDTPIPAGGLRYVSAGRFGYSWFLAPAPQATVEVQLQLNNGDYIILDDWASPSTQGPPDTEATATTFTSLLLTPEQAEELEGLTFIGWRWRVHKASPWAFQVGPGCGTSCDETMDLFFLYEFGACSGQPAVGPISIDPPMGSSFPAGSAVTLSGQVLSVDPSLPVQALLIDGQPADSIDSLGRFFKQVTVQEGSNLFTLDTLQATCGESTTQHELIGTPGGASLDGFATVTTLIDTEYRNSTYNQSLGFFQVEARGCNAAGTMLDTPLRLALRNIRGAGVEALRPDGLTDDGMPFVGFDQPASGLAPSGCTEWKPLLFDNPTGARVGFDPQWLAPLNQPPYFASVPITVTAADAPYRYEATAIDPEGDAPHYRLDQAPSGMAVDPSTGVIDWAPTQADVGTHPVTLVAADGFGGETSQLFAIEVLDGTVNRAPYFTSTPETRSPTGGIYLYDAAAADPDADGLTFTLLTPLDGNETFDSVSGVLTWGFALPGSYPIAIEVADGRGGFARQEFSLTVGGPAVNPTLPRIFGSPGPIAPVDQLYLYQPVLDNDDPGETVTFSLDPTPPAGMVVDPTSGRIDWTPTIGQLGFHPVTLRADDGNGGATTQSFTIEVVASAPNRAPVVDTVPALTATVDAAYLYQVNATDPDGDVVTYLLINPEPGMTIDPATGRIDWIPTTIGTFLVAIQVTDGNGGSGAQVFELEVFPPNSPPTITSTPSSTTVRVGRTMTYQVEATDPDGDPLSYRLLEAPLGMDIHPDLGTLSWTPRISQQGDVDVTIRALDTKAGFDLQELTFTVEPDDIPPTVTLDLSSMPAVQSTDFRVCVVADDDVAVTALRLFVDGVEQPLTLDGCAILRYDVATSVLLRGEAEDAGQNVGFEEVVQDVIYPDDVSRPVVVIESLQPVPGASLTDPAEIRATIFEPQQLPIVWWEVRLARGNSDQFELLSSGSGEQTDALLANLDPTVLPNDVYKLQIEASNGLATGGVQYEVSVIGEYKPGQFTSTIYDGTWSAGGVPIGLLRTYDSLEAQGPSGGSGPLASLDLGPGWSLSLPGEVTDTPFEQRGTDLDALFLTESFLVGQRIYVDSPEGGRLGFTFQPDLGRYLTATPNFVPDPGVDATLEAIPRTGTPTLWIIGGVAYEYFIPYNPETYILTTAAGVHYTINEYDGLIAIDTADGTHLDVTADGIKDAGGNGIQFDRDGSGRLTGVRQTTVGEPGPQAGLTFDYDGSDRLIRSTDAIGDTLEFFYEEPAHPNLLTRLEGPGGDAIARVVYDAAGRRVAECPPGGDTVTLDGCMQVSYDLANQITTVFDNLGNRTDYVLDDFGQAVAERVYTDALNYLETLYAYDADGNLLSQTLPSGDLWQWVYDEAGQEIQRIEPGGETWNQAYGDCGLAERCDPLGDCWTFLYDDDCNAIGFTDPLSATTTLFEDTVALENSRTDAEGNRWTSRFNPSSGYLSEIEDPTGGLTTYQYDNNGRPVQISDPEGRTISYTVDDAQRPATESWNTTPPTVFNYAFANGGQLTQVDDGTTRLAWSYLPSGQPSREETTRVADGAVLDGADFEYDANTNLTAVTSHFGVRTEYDYDSSSRVVEVRQSGGGFSDKRVELVYDEAARTTTYRYFTGLATTVPDVETVWTYACWECPGRLSSIEHREGSGALIERFDLVRDTAGNIVGMTDADGSHLLEYDALWRLTDIDRPGALPDESYRYDTVGNRTESSQSSQYDYQYQQTDCTASGLCGLELVEDDAWQYLYDAVGNQIVRTDRGSGDYNQYAYDHRDRLTGIERFDAGDSLLGTTRYVYDPANRRITRETDGLLRRTHYAGANPIAESDAAGTPILHRIYLPGMDQLLGEEEAGQVRWYLMGPGGTPSHVWSSGSLLARMQTDAFGQPTGAATPVGSSTIGFKGREQTPGSDEPLYVRARYYDPQTGRFLSADPLLPNRYDGWANNPYRYSDPSGRSVALEYGCMAEAGATNATIVVMASSRISAGVIRGAASASDGVSGWGASFRDAMLFWADEYDRGADRAKAVNEALEGLCKATGDNRLLDEIGDKIEEKIKDILKDAAKDKFERCTGWEVPEIPSLPKPGLGGLPDYL